jgi:DNA-binding MarR family transcriptional regulator
MADLTALLPDLATYLVLGASAFFVVLSIALLYRYRQASQKLVTSSDLGQVVVESLEARLRKQDERILDMMARFEVIQSRFLKEPAGKAKEEIGVLGLPAPPPEETKPEGVTAPAAPSQPSHEVTSQPPASAPPPAPAPDTTALQSLESRLTAQDGRVMEMMGKLAAIQTLLEMERSAARAQPEARPQAKPPTHVAKVSQKRLLEMLAEKPKTPLDVRDRFGVTREHGARLLNALFAKGLATRDDSGKPYVYSLSDQGRAALASD